MKLTTFGTQCNKWKTVQMPVILIYTTNSGSFHYQWTRKYLPDLVVKIGPIHMRCGTTGHIHVHVIRHIDIYIQHNTVPTSSKTLSWRPKAQNVVFGTWTQWEKRTQYCSSYQHSGHLIHMPGSLRPKPSSTLRKLLLMSIVHTVLDKEAVTHLLETLLANPWRMANINCERPANWHLWP